MILIECPYCSEKTGDDLCQNCEADVSVFLGVRSTAEQAYAKAWSHARDGEIPEALSTISVATILYDDERFHELAGWLHFLAGNPGVAIHHWNDVPQEAVGAAENYNAALGLAREGKLDRALERLRSIEVQLQPAKRLREAIESEAERPQASESTPAALPWVVGRPAATGAVALLLLLLGAWVGHSLTTRDATRTAQTAPRVVAPAERTPTVEDRPQPGSTNETNEKLLRAFLTNEPDEIYRQASVDRLSSDPMTPIGEQIPEAVRKRTSLSWYRQGQSVFQSGNHEGAQRNLLASLATIGLEAEDYWIDDALYFLALSLRDEGEVEQAQKVATLLTEEYPGSMYVNSHIRTLVTTEAGGPR